MKKEDPIQVGNRLKAIRKALGLSQKEFAQGLEKSASYVSEMESGKTKPGFNFLVELFEKHKINPAWVILEEEEMFISDSSSGNKQGDTWDFGGQTKEVYDMIDYMEKSPFVRSTLISNFMKFLYENEKIIRKDIDKNKDKR
jgi:transcriptional regulator with XRE-family HTH domain